MLKLIPLSASNKYFDIDLKITIATASLTIPSPNKMGFNTGNSVS
jgi:hypothetical protein